MLPTVIASIGFLIAVASFIGGFRMIRMTDHEAESLMHRANGFITIGFYLLLAVMYLVGEFSLLALFLWILGFLIHLAKIPLVRYGYAVRYGGYFGALLLITWLTIIFTHLPE